MWQQCFIILCCALVELSLLTTNKVSLSKMHRNVENALECRKRASVRNTGIGCGNTPIALCCALEELSLRIGCGNTSLPSSNESNINQHFF